LQDGWPESFPAAEATAVSRTLFSGSFIGGWVFTKLGIFGGGFIYSLAAATLGAVILVAIVHLFTGGPKN